MEPEGKGLVKFLAASEMKFGLGGSSGRGALYVQLKLRGEVKRRIE